MTDNIIQGSEEWKQLRCGLITGSQIANVMQEKKGTGYANYMAQLVAERLTGCVAETYKNAYMERGNEDESAARDCYSFITGNEVRQVAFIKHPKISCFGISPDGILPDGNLLEIKRKIPALHIDYLLKNRVPPEYIKQMAAQLSCTGADYVEFASYCPEMPENMQLFIIRYNRDDKLIAEMEKAVIEFNQSVEKMISDLQALKS